MGALSILLFNQRQQNGAPICNRLTTIKVTNHENNPLPIKKTGKKTPAGMGKATDTAVIINCNKTAKKREYLLCDMLQTASLQNHNVQQTTALFSNTQPFN